jgi:hypothetical protein
MATTTTKPPRLAGSPYCNNCGYDLSNLTESSKCPECGRPLVEVLTRGPRVLESGTRYRSKATLLGLPVIDVALGPKHGELRGRAKGIIAVGDIATGGIAVGGFARGIVAVGGFSLGGFSLGGASVGLFAALGGGALGGIAIGGGAAGAVAQGGGALGYVAQGGGAAGVYARGAGAWGAHVISLQPPVNDPAAVEMFDKLSWLVGSWPPSQLSLLTGASIPVLCTVAVATVIGLIALFALRSEPDG